MSDPEESTRRQVSAANRAFYDAFESLDMARMQAVWSADPLIACVHPGWELLLGWEQVMESWRAIFANTLSIRFNLSGELVLVRGDVAWVHVTEDISSSGLPAGSTAATNIFERRDGSWLMLHHHASPFVRHMTVDPSRVN